MSGCITSFRIVSEDVEKYPIVNELIVQRVGDVE
jgi:hypothetical protein